MVAITFQSAPVEEPETYKSIDISELEDGKERRFYTCNQMYIWGCQKIGTVADHDRL